MNLANNSPVWLYFGSIVFPIVGVFLIKKWKRNRKKDIERNASAWDKAVTNYSLKVGLLGLFAGIVFIIELMKILLFSHR